MKESPTILIIGAGAIGGIIAGILKKKGFDITMLVRSPESARIINEYGLSITGNCGHIEVNVNTVFTFTSIKKRPDIVLIATKAEDMPNAAKAIMPLLDDEESIVVSLQNGIVEEELASIIGVDRTVGCVVGWGATMHSKREMEMTSSGEFVIGYLDSAPDEKLKKLAEILENILPVEMSDSILNDLYSKLIINSCITTVGAICGLTTGEMLSQKLYRNIFLNIIEEAIDVANAMKMDIPSYAGKLNYYELLGWSTFRKHLFLRAFGFKYRRLKSSSLQSLERGQKTEVRYFNGYISEKGKKYEVETPVNDLMVKLLEEIEDGKRKISHGNFL